MPGPRNLPCLRWRWSPAIVIPAAVAAMLAGVALAKASPLGVARKATVSNMVSHVTKHESIVVDSRGFAVYYLTGETAHHLLCTSKTCFMFWPPVKVASAKGLSSAPGIKGRLGTVRRQGFLQLTLGGRPLYTFGPDTKKDVATGEGIVSFGGTWHVIAASSAKSAGDRPASGAGSTQTSSPRY